jgi:hypothetical protein
MGVQAFTKLGNTVTFTANTSAPTPVQASSDTLGGNQYRIINAGNVSVFIGAANTSASASTNAGNVATSIPILANTQQVLTFLPNAYFTGTTSSGTAVIYVTPGDGI